MINEITKLEKILKDLNDDLFDNQFVSGETYNKSMDASRIVRQLKNQMGVI